MIENKDIWDQIEDFAPPDSLEAEMFHLLSAYVDGECTPSERRLVEAYLNESSAARRLLAELRAQACVLVSSTEDPPTWLGPSILARTIKRRKSRLLPLVFAGSAATACAVLVALVAFLGAGRLPESAAAGGGSELEAPSFGVSTVDLGEVEPSIKGDPPLVASADNVRKPRLAGFSVNLGSRPQRLAGVAEGESPVRPGTLPGHGTAEGETGGGHSGDAETMNGPVYGPTVRATPEQPDVVAMASQATYEDSDTALEKASSPAGTPADDREPEVREVLRQRLRKLNDNRSGLKEVLRGAG